jgi:beta-hydroxyacyl-ACP dehydratase FabZ
MADIDVLEIEDIKKLIPHRYPMLLVDRILDLEYGVRVRGIKSVTANEPFFQGHFPDKPIMPGVLIVEAMAQVGAVLVIASLGAKASGRPVYFMAIDKVKFRKMVVPGDRLEFEVEAIQNRGKVWKLKGVAKVDGKVVTEAESTAMIDLAE